MVETPSIDDISEDRRATTGEGQNNRPEARQHDEQAFKESISEVEPAAAGGRRSLTSIFDLPDRTDLSRIQADSLVVQADEGHVHAKEAVMAHLLSGDNAIVDAINARSDHIDEPMVSLLNGLADLGDPGIHALARLNRSGFDFTMDGLGRAAGAIASTGSWS